MCKKRMVTTAKKKKSVKKDGPKVPKAPVGRPRKNLGTRISDLPLVSTIKPAARRANVDSVALQRAKMQFKRDYPGLNVDEYQTRALLDVMQDPSRGAIGSRVLGPAEKTVLAQQIEQEKKAKELAKKLKKANKEGQAVVNVDGNTYVNPAAIAAIPAAIAAATSSALVPVKPTSARRARPARPRREVESEAEITRRAIREAQANQGLSFENLESDNNTVLHDRAALQQLMARILETPNGPVRDALVAQAMRDSARIDQRAARAISERQVAESSAAATATPGQIRTARAISNQLTANSSSEDGANRRALDAGTRFRAAAPVVREMVVENLAQAVQSAPAGSDLAQVEIPTTQSSSDEGFAELMARLNRFRDPGDQGQSQSQSQSQRQAPVTRTRRTREQPDVFLGRPGELTQLFPPPPSLVYNEPENALFKYDLIQAKRRRDLPARRTWPEYGPVHNKPPEYDAGEAEWRRFLKGEKDRRRVRAELASQRETPFVDFGLDDRMNRRNYDALNVLAESDKQAATTIQRALRGLKGRTAARAAKAERAENPELYDRIRRAKQDARKLLREDQKQRELDAIEEQNQRELDALSNLAEQGDESVRPTSQARRQARIDRAKDIAKTRAETIAQNAEIESMLNLAEQGDDSVRPTAQARRKIIDDAATSMQSRLRGRLARKKLAEQPPRIDTVLAERINRRQELENLLDEISRPHVPPASPVGPAPVLDEANARLAEERIAALAGRPRLSPADLAASRIMLKRTPKQRKPLGIRKPAFAPTEEELFKRMRDLKPPDQEIKAEVSEALSNVTDNVLVNLANFLSNRREQIDGEPRQDWGDDEPVAPVAPAYASTASGTVGYQTENQGEPYNQRRREGYFTSLNPLSRYPDSRFSMNTILEQAGRSIEARPYVPALTDAERAIRGPRDTGVQLPERFVPNPVDRIIVPGTERYVREAEDFPASTEAFGQGLTGGSFLEQAVYNELARRRSGSVHGMGYFDGFKSLTYNIHGTPDDNKRDLAAAKAAYAAKGGRMNDDRTDFRVLMDAMKTIRKPTGGAMGGAMGGSIVLSGVPTPLTGGSGWTLQAVTFPDKDWKTSSSLRWLRSNGIKPIKKADKQGTLFRYRIVDPKGFTEYYTSDLMSRGRKIHLVYGK